MQLMHSFEVNIRFCQPENSDVHQGEANAPIVLLYDTVSLFLVLYKVFSYINLLKSDVPSALSLGRVFQQYTYQISATLMR